MAAPQRPSPFRDLLARLRADPRARMGALVGGPALVVVVVLVVVLLSGGGEDSNGVGIKSTRATPAAGDDFPPGYVANAPAVPVEATAPPLVRSIAELHEVFGEPPFANVGRMRIPALGIDAPISLRIVGEDGAMPNPVGPDEVTLYDLSAWDGLGGTPGGGGNTILSGHVDQRDWLDYAQVQYEGLAVFYHLDNLTPGQSIELDVYGGRHSYVVQWVREVAASSGEWAQILGPDPSGAESITLITCGGEFNAVEGSYASRVVVRAVAG